MLELGDSCDTIPSIWVLFLPHKPMTEKLRVPTISLIHNSVSYEDRIIFQIALRFPYRRRYPEQIKQILHLQESEQENDSSRPRSLAAKSRLKEILEPPKATAAPEWDTEQASEVIRPPGDRSMISTPSVHLYGVSKSNVKMG